MPNPIMQRFWPEPSGLWPCPCQSLASVSLAAFSVEASWRQMAIPTSNMNIQDMSALFEESDHEGEQAAHLAEPAAVAQPLQCELCGQKPEACSLQLMLTWPCVV